MIKSFVKYYYYFFDEKVKNGTLVVFLVTALILAIGFLSKHEQILSHLKTTLIDKIF